MVVYNYRLNPILSPQVDYNADGLKPATNNVTLKRPQKALRPLFSSLLIRFVHVQVFVSNRVLEQMVGPGLVCNNNGNKN